MRRCTYAHSARRTFPEHTNNCGEQSASRRGNLSVQMSMQCCMCNYHLLRISTSLWGNSVIACRRPLSSILANRCLLSSIFLWELVSVCCLKKLETFDEIRRMFLIRNTAVFFFLKSMLPIRSWKHLHWANAQADLQAGFGIVNICLTWWKHKHGWYCMKHWDGRRLRLFINSYPTWPDLLSRSYQVAPVSSLPRIAKVTDPITLHLHTLSQSYIVMVTYPENRNISHIQASRFLASNLRSSISCWHLCWNYVSLPATG
jgi:hypothetical protein